MMTAGHPPLRVVLPAALLSALAMTAGAGAEPFDLGAFATPPCVTPGQTFTFNGFATANFATTNAHLLFSVPPGTSCGDADMTPDQGAPAKTSCFTIGGTKYQDGGPENGTGRQCNGVGAWPANATEHMVVNACQVPATWPVGTPFPFGFKAFDANSNGFYTWLFKTVDVKSDCAPPPPTVSIGKAAKVFTDDSETDDANTPTATKLSLVCYTITAVGGDVVIDDLPPDFVFKEAIYGTKCTLTGTTLRCTAPSLAPYGGGPSYYDFCGWFKNPHPAPGVANVAKLEKNGKIGATSNAERVIVLSTEEDLVAAVSGPSQVAAGATASFTQQASSAAAPAATTATGYAWLSSDLGVVPVAFGPTLTRSFPAAGSYKVTALTTRNRFTARKDFTVKVVAGTAGCSPNATTLCLGPNGRFRVQVDWQNLPGKVSNVAQAHPLTSDTGAFWFFSPENLELLVKVLDATSLNQKFWVFYGALSNVQYEIKVTDTKTGVVKVYTNLQDTQASVADTAAFAAATSPAEVETEAEPISFSESADGPHEISEAASSCVTGGTSLCLASRFRVAVAWKTAAGATGQGVAGQLTPDTGDFWFFNAANLELMMKIIDGRTLNGKFWFFYGALSDVEYTITVTDTQTGVTKTYKNPQGQQASVADTAAF